MIWSTECFSFWRRHQSIIWRHFHGQRSEVGILHSCLGNSNDLSSNTQLCATFSVVKWRGMLVQNESLCKCKKGNELTWWKTRRKFFHSRKSRKQFWDTWCHFDDILTSQKTQHFVDTDCSLQHLSTHNQYSSPIHEITHLHKSHSFHLCCTLD